MGKTNVYGKYCIIFLHSKLVSEDKEFGWNVCLKFDVNQKRHGQRRKKYVSGLDLKRDRVDEAERCIHEMGLHTKKNFQMF